MWTVQTKARKVGATAVGIAIWIWKHQIVEYWDKRKMWRFCQKGSVTSFFSSLCLKEWRYDQRYSVWQNQNAGKKRSGGKLGRGTRRWPLCTQGCEGMARAGMFIPLGLAKGTQGVPPLLEKETVLLSQVQNYTLHCFIQLLHQKQGAVSGGRGILGECGGVNNPVHYVR